MNKLVLAAVAALTVALLGAHALVGALIEARVRERVAAIDASSDVAAEITSFERGWFRSSAKIALRRENPDVATLGGLGTQPEESWLSGGWDPLESTCRHASLSIL